MDKKAKITSEKVNIESYIRDMKKMGIPDESIIDYYREYNPKYLKIAKDYLQPKKINLKKMEKETKDFQKQIEDENEEWNRRRKEIKYLNVKKSKKKVVTMDVTLEIDKTGKKLIFNTNMYTDKLSSRIQKYIIKELARLMKEQMTKGKEYLDFESDSDSDN